MRVSSITPQYVNIIPDHLEDGVLYVCERFGTVAHKCCCGCGEEVITPLTPADWSIRKEKGAVSLSPSIGNWSFACKSHYFITRNQIIWAGALTARQIAAVRAEDKKNKVAYIAAINKQKAKQVSVFGRLWQAFVGWWRS